MLTSNIPFPFVLALSAALVMGCGDEDETPAESDAGADVADTGTDAAEDTVEDAGPATVTGTQWCRQSAGVWCDWMYACFDDNDINMAEQGFRFEVEQRCLSTLDADCQARTLVSVADGRQQFNEEEASACLDALLVEPCGTFDEMVAGDVFNPPACFDVSTGLVDRGGECTNSPDCSADDSICWYTVDLPGYCTGQLGRDSFVEECDPAAETNTCEGVLCLGLPENGADLLGICSAFCRTDRNCGPDAGCFQLEEAQLCLGLCETDDDCGGDLVCLPTGDRSACTAPPL